MSEAGASRGGYPVAPDLAGRLCPALVAAVRDRPNADFGPEWEAVARISRRYGEGG